MDHGRDPHGTFLNSIDNLIAVREYLPDRIIVKLRNDSPCERKVGKNVCFPNDRSYN